MKNEDRIVIKPGQTWFDGGKLKANILYTCGEWVVVKIETGAMPFVVAVDEFRREFTLITSHDGADLEAARAEGWELWVEGMERPSVEKVETVETFTPFDGWEAYQEPKQAAYMAEHAYRYKLKTEEPEPEPIAADESCHVLTQLIIDVMPYEILENAYWEFDAMRKMSKSTERDAFKRVARMTISATVNHLLSRLK